MLGITLGLLFWLIGGLRQIGQEIQFTGKARIAGRPILAGSVVGSTLFLLFTLTISGSSAIVAQIGQDDPLSYISSAWNAVHIMMAMLLLLIFIGWRIATINTTVIQITAHKSVFQAIRSSLLAPLLVTFGFTLGSTAVGSMIGVWFAAVRFFMHMGAALAVLLSLLFIPFIFLRYGGFTLIQHLCIRIILALGGYLPMRLVALLDYCVQIGLLYRIGGGYRFIHTVLQNHYAEIHK